LRCVYQMKKPLFLSSMTRPSNKLKLNSFNIFSSLINNIIINNLQIREREREREREGQDSSSQSIHMSHHHQSVKERQLMNHLHTLFLSFTPSNFYACLHLNPQIMLYLNWYPRAPTTLGK
jgi:hypothetical protein